MEINMGENTSGSILSFYIHELFFYGYLHVLPWSQANPSSRALNCLSHHWCDETPCLDVRSHHLGKANISNIDVITCNNDVAWSMSWIPPFFIS